MAIANTTDFWTSRMNGGDPSTLTAYGQDNNSFTLSGSAVDGSASGGAWRITDANGGQQWSLTPTTNAYTMVACIKYEDTPTVGTIFMTLDNGTHKVHVESAGGDNVLKLVGTTTVQTGLLDIKEEAAFEPTPLILRLTLDADGNAKLYIREIVEDDAGADLSLSVTGASSTNKTIKWGNSDGTVLWNNVYVSDMGAFSPDEMSTSSFVTDSLLRMGLSMVQTLKDSKRFFLKNYVDDSSIVYGFDISSQMVSRIPAPSIHLILRQMDSPGFTALGGSRVEQNFTVVIFVATRGTDYKNAYRSGLEIVGDVFDELYTTTGLKGTTDSLTNYLVQFDTKMDNDEVVCVHRMELTYMRRLNMLHR
jgi:hypothetical protein